MKTPIFIFLSVCFIISAKAQSDSSGILIKNHDAVSVQLAKQNTSLLNPTGTLECNKPLNTVFFGKKTDNGLPYVPPDSDGDGSTTYYPPTEGDVNIYWIHGLNGSVESLRVPAVTTEFGTMDRTFVARKAHSIIGLTAGDQTYLENQGIAYAARDMRTVANNLQGTYTPTNKDFIIAHSQGGIVAREWLRDIEEDPGLFKKYVHGLVTFGTPHGGAMILNTTRPDLLNRAPKFFGEACTKLGKAVVADKVKNKFLLSMFLSQEMKDRLVGLSCTFFSETVVPFALDNYHKPTTLDYYVESPFLTKPSSLHPSGGLSDYVLKVPVVQFYGEEEQPIMWRFFSSTMELGKDQVLQPGNAAGEYAYDKDDQLQDKVSNLMNDFQASYNDAAEKYKKWKTVKKLSLFSGPLILTMYPISSLAAQNNKDNMDAYDGAKVWLANANDYYLAELVGAKETKPVKYCITSTCERCYDLTTLQVTVKSDVVETLAGPNGCFNGFYYARQYMPNSHTSCRDEKQGTTVYRNEYYYKANDGIVLAESAANPIKVDTGNPLNTHNYCIMPSTNHDQMKNSNQTKQALTVLYDGKLGAFFKIPPRQ